MAEQSAEQPGSPSVGSGPQSTGASAATGSGAATRTGSRGSTQQQQGAPPSGYVLDAAGNEVPVSDEGMPSQAEMDQLALDKEKSMARTRGAPEDQLAEWESKLIWVHSNRKDDRTVIYEVDPIHPGGQAFVGGEGPDHVYRTEAIEQHLQSGELIEVPEPVKTVTDDSGEEVPNPYYPDQNYTQGGDVPANMPGQPIQLGRKLNPMLWSDDQITEIQRRQAYMPAYRPVPAGTIVPPAMPAGR